MQKSFKIRFPHESDYENLKILWQTAFDDTKESLDYFFENSVSPDRALAVFEDNKPVCALYMLESEILNDNKIYSAYYIYAVCTHPEYRSQGLMKMLFKKLIKITKERNVDYLFLVPEEEHLFKIYEKLGFENGFFYSQKTLFKKDFSDVKKFVTRNLTYEDYREIIKTYLPIVPVAILKESTFNSFFNSVSGEIKTIFTENEGYALYEETEEKLIVYELFGNEKILIGKIFECTKKEKIICRQLAKENPVPYGMYYKLNNVPEIRNGFFGIPYSN